ncbi:hypothetical protein FJ958_20570 [Mesorhizobium sp. B2-3-5]|nr:hypothetical protein FJ958_20570 [Mesorhizobium sp. B2-3-5]
MVLPGHSLGFEFLADAGAAPHLPAGILSPYSDGERGALAAALLGFRTTNARQGNEGRRRHRRSIPLYEVIAPSAFDALCPGPKCVARPA